MNTISRTKWDLIPIHNMDVATMPDAYEISRIMKTLEIDWYVYAIIYKKSILIKYGMSADNSWNYGERLYRQIGHIQTWGDKVLTGSSGADWLQTEIDFTKLHGTNIDHNHITLKIYNLTNYPFEGIDSRKEIESIESELINNHVKMFGEKPIGNIHDEANALNQPIITKEVINNLFIDFPFKERKRA